MTAEIHPDGRPPLRADHIAGLLRPAKPRDAFKAHAARRVGDAELRAPQDEANREAQEVRGSVDSRPRVNSSGGL